MTNSTSFCNSSIKVLRLSNLFKLLGKIISHLVNISSSHSSCLIRLLYASLRRCCWIWGCCLLSSSRNSRVFSWSTSWCWRRGCCQRSHWSCCCCCICCCCCNRWWHSFCFGSNFTFFFNKSWSCCLNNWWNNNRQRLTCCFLCFSGCFFNFSNWTCWLNINNYSSRCSNRWLFTLAKSKRRVCCLKLRRSSLFSSLNIIFRFSCAQ